MERQPGLVPSPVLSREIVAMPSLPSRLPIRSVRRRVSAIAALAMAAMAAAGCCLGRAEAATAIASPTRAFEAHVDPVASLEAARARTARARALLDALKRATQPGHLLDLLPTGEGTFAIEDLRGQYSTLQLKAATLATTLGDHHPDLVAAQQALADLRNQLLTAVRTAAASAERDLGEARAAESAAEHQLASRTADVTGSIGPPAPALAKAPPPRPPLDVVAGSGGREASVGVAPARDPEGQASALTTMADDDWDRLMTALAAVILGALAAAVALFALLKPRRPPSRNVNRPIVVPAEARGGALHEAGRSRAGHGRASGGDRRATPRLHPGPRAGRHRGTLCHADRRVDPRGLGGRGLQRARLGAGDSAVAIRRGRGSRGVDCRRGCRRWASRAVGGRPRTRPPSRNALGRDSRRPASGARLHHPAGL